MKNIFDYKHVKSVSMMILQDKTTREIRGKIIANFSDNPNGSVCTAQIISYDYQGQSNPLILLDPCIGKAGGYGYDKLSTAVAQALRKAGFGFVGFSGRGMESKDAQEFFAGYNLELVQVL